MPRMSLRQRAALWIALRWWRAAGQGKKGESMKKAFDLLMRNRARIGGLLMAVAAGLATYPDLREVSAFVAMAGTYLLGSGAHKPDATYRQQG